MLSNVWGPARFLLSYDLVRGTAVPTWPPLTHGTAGDTNRLRKGAHGHFLPYVEPMLHAVAGVGNTVLEGVIQAVVGSFISWLLTLRRSRLNED